MRVTFWFVVSLNDVLTQTGNFLKRANMDRSHSEKRRGPSSSASTKDVARTRPPAKNVGGRFEVLKKLGAGVFGEVWLGRDKETKEEVGVKFEHMQGHSLQLAHEVDILKSLSQPAVQQGFVQSIYFGQEGLYHCLVMDLLGKSLEDLMEACRHKFTVRTTILVAEQVLQRIEYLHSKGVLHRDIKPENFMFGTKKRTCILHMIDFGLSKCYYSTKHVAYRGQLALTGTARYASINTHKGCEQSRRDDLEAIGHMLFYFLRGALPWSGLIAKNQEEKYRKIKEKKMETPLHELGEGYPEQFQTYLQYCRKLEFKERPNYNMLYGLFRSLRVSEDVDRDDMFQWLEGKDLSAFAPLEPIIPPNPNLKQPDDIRPFRRCFCCRFSSAKED